MLQRKCIACIISALLVVAMITACTPSSPSGGAGQGEPFDPVFNESVFDPNAVHTDGVNAIDFSHCNKGYIGIASISEGKLKAQVQNGEFSYNYDLPNDGTPIIVPVNMGDGAYTVRVMQNTDGNRYLELYASTADVVLASEEEPYVRPNVFCNYTQQSACVALATELCANAQTQGEAFDAIYDFISSNISYDGEKASRLEDVTGYVPDPDATLASRSGICFDYASLTAAMLRSQGIPCKILTGYVSPDNIYHAWDMIYLDGSWTSLHISAPADNWARADMTFAATGAGATIGDGSSYNDRYTY